MKKIIVFLFSLTIFLFLFNLKKENNVIIPSDSLRFRIIASSNSLADQRLKLKLSSIILPKLQEVSALANNSDEASSYIQNILNDLQKEISLYTSDFTMSFGNNYFPEKNYKGVTYEAGNYPSLVITLGKGQGNNWWCVMFPPLCLLEAEEENLDEVTYTTYLKTIINKYF